MSIKHTLLDILQGHCCAHCALYYLFPETCCKAFCRNSFGWRLLLLMWAIRLWHLSIISSSEILCDRTGRVDIFFSVYSSLWVIFTRHTLKSHPCSYAQLSVKCDGCSVCAVGESWAAATLSPWLALPPGASDCKEGRTSACPSPSHGWVEHTQTHSCTHTPLMYPSLHDSHLWGMLFTLTMPFA